MTGTATATLGLAAWALFLSIAIVIYRLQVAMTTGKEANTFSPTGEDVSEFGRRLYRAHANVFENVPFLLAILLYALATGQSGVTDGLAVIVLAARILQSLVHLVGTSVPLVMIRFLFYLIQLGIGVYWVIGLWGGA